MKPKPLVELNHLTVPVAFCPSAIAEVRVMGRAWIRVGPGNLLRERKLMTALEGRTELCTAHRRAESIILRVENLRWNCVGCLALSCLLQSRQKDTQNIPSDIAA